MAGNLILASLDKENLTSWKQGLEGFVSVIVITDSLGKLWDDVVHAKSEILILDYDLQELDGLHGVANLRRLCAETRVIILSDIISEDAERDLLRAGVRGCCSNDIEPKLLYQVVMAVQQGEFWIRRTLTFRLIDELGKQYKRTNPIGPPSALSGVSLVGG